MLNFGQQIFPVSLDMQVLLSGRDDAPTRCAFENVNENLKVYLKVEGNLDPQAEREKLRQKMEEVQK